MTRSRRLLIALATTALLAVFGGTVQGIATTRGQVEPGSPAAGALERLQDRADERQLRRMTTADCPWLRDSGDDAS